MAAALISARDVGKVGLTPSARELWTDVVYPALSESPPADGPLAQFTARATPYARRIAMVYALADGKAVVETTHLTAAYYLVNYSRATAAHVLGGASGTGDPYLDKVLAAIQDAGGRGLSRQDVSALFSRNLNAAALDDLLAKLEALPNIVRSRRTGVGRPADVWTLRSDEGNEGNE